MQRIRRHQTASAALPRKANRRKLIRYSRGAMQILDARGLLAASCSCYAVIREIEAA
jgi:hypothetical protein